MDEDLMPIEKQWATKMEGCAPGECLEADALLELAERGKRSRDYSARMAHVAVCRNCRETFKMLRGVEMSRPRPVFGWLGQPKTGLAVMAVAAAALAIFFISQSGVSGFDKTKQGPLASGTKKEIVTPKNIVIPPKREEVAQRENAPPKAPRLETPRTPRGNRNRKGPSPARTPVVIPEKTMVAEVAQEPGIVEGEVVYTMVLEGEVSGGEVLKGEVVPPKPPPHSELR